MRVLYISLKAEFGADGDESQGYSYEYSHIWDGWQKLAERRGDITVVPWWIDQSSEQELRHLVDEKPDLIFSLPVNWHNDAPFQILNYAESRGIPIVQFDCDPLRRFDNSGDPWIVDRFQRKLATHFLCPAPHMIPRYQARGMPVRKMHFGCPSWIDRDESIEQDIDVSFVGQCHGIRHQVIEQLRSNGINVKVFGRFWPGHPDNHGPVSEEEMNRIFNRSKVNLNLTWISQPPYQHQIKGRHAELVGAGAFQIATYGQEEMLDVEDICTPGTDFIQCYTVDDIIDTIKWSCGNSKRRDIADNAYARRHENLWETRLEEFVEYWPEWHASSVE